MNLREVVYWRSRYFVGSALVKLDSIIGSKGGVDVVLFRLGLLADKLLAYVKSRGSERAYEYGWVLKNLPKNGRRKLRILDVGCTGSRLPYEYIHRNYFVYAVDTRAYEVKRADLHFYSADAIKTPFPEEFFDYITLVSTLEHVGLGYYGDPVYSNGDLLVVKEIIRILKRGGKLLITLPFASSAWLKWHRIYDQKRIHQLAIGFKILKEEIYIPYFRGVWRKSKTDAVNTARKDKHAVCCLMLEKI